MILVIYPITPFGGQLDEHDRIFRRLLSAVPVGSSTQVNMLTLRTSRRLNYLSRFLFYG